MESELCKVGHSPRSRGSTRILRSRVSGITGLKSQRKNTPRVLAIASGGGHWVQLLRMRPAWDGCQVIYATTHADYVNDLAVAPGHGAMRFHTFPDANRWQKLRLLRQLFAIGVIMLRERPDVVVSTGASAGYFALRIAKLLRRRTIWVDSI